MKLLIEDGRYLTTTETRSIRQILEAGQTFGRNKPNTKTYDFIEGWSEGDKRCYKVKIGSVTTPWCELKPKWQYRTITVKLTS